MKNAVDRDAAHRFDIGAGDRLAISDDGQGLERGRGQARGFGRGKKFLGGISPVADKFIRGWQLNGIQTYRSGTLIGVSGGGALPLFGGANRPNWSSSDVRSSVSAGSFDPARDRYLNISAFSQPAPYTFGSAPPRMPHVRTPFYRNEDIFVTMLADFLIILVEPNPYSERITRW